MIENFVTHVYPYEFTTDEGCARAFTDQDLIEWFLQNHPGTTGYVRIENSMMVEEDGRMEYTIVVVS